MIVSIQRFKPGGKWYETFEMDVPVEECDVKSPDTAGSAIYKAHAWIRTQYEDHTDRFHGWHWYHSHPDMFPVLHVSDAPSEALQNVLDFLKAYTSRPRVCEMQGSDVAFRVLGLLEGKRGQS